MKLALVPAATSALLLVPHAPLVSGFLQSQSLGGRAPARSIRTGGANANAGSNSALFGMGMGTGESEDGPSKPSRDAWNMNPESFIHAHIGDEVPELAVRSDLGDAVLVSGWVDPATMDHRADQAIFDLLNDSDGAFAASVEDGVEAALDHAHGINFSSIVAFVPDAKLAKKRLVSRSARYSGLLNKLQFAQGEEEGGLCLPTPEQLDGVTTWVARVDAGDAAANLELVRTAVYRARSSSTVRNVAFLLCDSDQYAAEAFDIIKAVQADGAGAATKTFTAVSVGKADANMPEATHPYSVRDLAAKATEATEATEATVPGPSDTGLPYAPPASAKDEDAAEEAASAPLRSFSQEESYRLLTTCLGLECGRNRAFAFAEVRDVNATSAKLVRGLREAGYGWADELQHMADGGVQVSGRSRRVVELGSFVQSPPSSPDECPCFSCASSFPPSSLLTLSLSAQTYESNFSFFIQKYEQAIADYKERNPQFFEEGGGMMMSSDEKLEDAIAEAMEKQKRENEEALARMEAKTSEFVLDELEMTPESIPAGSDWA